MLHKVTPRVLAIAACACFLASHASALTVGRARGAVLIGRPLELAIPVTLDRADDEPCASADLFYGEERVRTAPTTRWQAGAGGQGVLHVSSPAVVTEPMVTVYLRVGCGQATTRRLVMLAEMPPDAESTLPGPARNTAPVQLRGVQQPAASREAPAAVRPRSNADLPAATAPAPLPRARKPAREEAGRPRLRLEPLDLGPDRDPALRLSTEMNTQPATDPQRREAAAALWAALQKGPDEILQDSLRLHTVEREMTSLRDGTRKNTAALAEMRAQVERARAGRSTAGVLVAALAAALIALLAWLGWRAYCTMRLQRVGRWFEQHHESTLDPLAATTAQGEPSTQPGSQAPAPVAAPAAKTAVVAATAGAASASAASADTATAAAAVPRPVAPVAPADEFQASRGGSMRMVGVDELIDVHDKADFFLSIGEVNQAIGVLEAHVHDQVETSALPWMDLLELYHSHGRRAEYERLRGEFRQRFTAQVPDFEHFAEPTATLENYSRALGRIVALWPSHRVLDVIEESIFRKPGLPGAEPFSLEAYRELVLLYHVARELSLHEGGAGEGSPFRDTSLQPLNMAHSPEAAAAALSEHDLLLIPPASARLGVDIDVGEFFADVPAHAASQAEPQLQLDVLGQPDLYSWSPEAQDGPRELPPLDFDLDMPDAQAAADSVRKRG